MLITQTEHFSSATLIYFIKDKFDHTTILNNSLEKIVFINFFNFSEIRDVYKVFDWF